MEDLVEKFISRVIGKNYSSTEYRQLLLELCNNAGDVRERSKILHDFRRFRQRLLKEKMEIERIIKGSMSELDDFLCERAKYFKGIENKYKYFYPNIQ